MFLRALPLIIGLLPVLGATLSHWLAASLELVPGCFAYVEGCTSISATGRYEPASFLFRAVHLPTAGLLAVFWPLAILWLRSLDRVNAKQERTILIAGIVGAVSLVVYVTFLGTGQPFYEFLRRYGIYGYFLGTAIAQLTLALTLLKIWRGAPASAMFWLAALPFALGILNLVLKAILDDADRWENRIEWIAALAMQLYYVSLWLAWRQTGFELLGASDLSATENPSADR